ncbi:MAG: DNA polymerase III subunit beta [Patescibacteria group bacterium]|jgi:DNA polymerase-3 subunit beta
MKLSCTQENLVRGVNAVGHLTGKNLSLPILSNILLRAEQGSVTLASTNLEVGITKKIRAKVEREGTYTIQGRVFLEFINLLPKEQVDIEVVDGALHIAAGKHESIIKGIPADEFPVIPNINKEKRVAIKAGVLREALQQTIFAAANDESRPEISGIYFVFENGILTVAATDSYRLAERRVVLDEGKDVVHKTILPVKTLSEILRILGDTSEMVEIFLEENQFGIVVDDLELVSRVIEGQYPDYQQIIPQESTTTATFGRQEFLNNVKAASLFVKPGINDLTIELNPESKKILFRAANTQVGEQSGEIESEMTGRGVELVFNYRYLLDGLTNFQSDTITLLANDQKNPGLFTESDKGDYRYLVMPIRQ